MLFDLFFRWYNFCGAEHVFMGLVLSGQISIISMIPTTLWHAHEMLFGFIGAIILVFLLTAVQNWTGNPCIKGPTLAFIFITWLLARIAMFAFPPKFFWLTMIF